MSAIRARDAVLLVTSSQAHQVNFERAALFAGTLDLKQGRFVILRLDLTEAALDSAGLDDEAVRKVAEEQRTLVAHYLPMLHRIASEEVVEFHGFVRSHSILVLRRFCADPEVEIWRHAAPSQCTAQRTVTSGRYAELRALTERELRCVRAGQESIHDDVGIAFEEFPVLGNWPSLDPKVGPIVVGSTVLNAPNLKSDLLASALPALCTPLSAHARRRQPWDRGEGAIAHLCRARALRLAVFLHRRGSKYAPFLLGLRRSEPRRFVLGAPDVLDVRVLHLVLGGLLHRPSLSVRLDTIRPAPASTAAAPPPRTTQVVLASSVECGTLDSIQQIDLLFILLVL